MSYLKTQQRALPPNPMSRAQAWIGFLFMLCIVWSCVVHNSDASPLGLYQDFVYCMERGACKFELICPFQLEADPSRCFMESCHALEGHIMAIHNALEHTIAVQWRTIDNSSVGGSLEVVAQTTRYFDTRLSTEETHSVGLAIEGQTVAIILLSPELIAPCTSEETCDYMLRTCYGVQEDVVGHAAMQRCIDYARHCHGFEKVNEERRQACIPSCLDTYYGHFFDDENVFGAYDSDLLVAILLELKHRGVDLSETRKEGVPSGDGLFDGILSSGEGIDLCGLAQCGAAAGGTEEGNQASHNLQETCHDMTLGLVVIGTILFVVFSALLWIIFRRCLEIYHQGNTMSRV